MNEPLREPSQSSVLVVGVGASRGLGAAIARRFWRAGHPVVIAGRNAEKLEKTAKELKHAGAKAAYGGGSLFFTGASASLRGKANFAPFASAKAAVRNLAQSIAREYGPKNIHVGHVVVDGGIEGDRLLSRAPHLLEQRGPDGMLHPDAIAEAYWDMHHQHRSAWTLELDVRPWSENF